MVYYDIDHETPTDLEFSSALDWLDYTRRDWWRRWRLKPKLRRGVRRRSITVYVHGNSYQNTSSSPVGISRRIKEYLGSARTALVVGRAGAGKGLLAHTLARNYEESGNRVLIANLAYTNDFLDVLQLACRHLAAADHILGTTGLVEEFFAILKAHKVACIFGSLDRILLRRQRYVQLDSAIRPFQDLDADTTTDGPTWSATQHILVPLGDPIDVDVAKFLQAFQTRMRCCNSERPAGSLVLLTSVFPTLLTNEGAPAEGVSYVSVHHGEVFPYARPDERSDLAERELELEPDVSRLRRPLDDHVFALLTTQSTFGLAELGAEARTDILELERRLTSVAVEHRPMQAVAELLKRLHTIEDYRHSGFLLERLSFFHAPVEEQVIDTILERSAEEMLQREGEQVDETALIQLQKQLRNRCRVLCPCLARIGFLIQTHDGPRHRVSYSVHPTVRMYFSHLAGRVSDAIHEPHLFSLSVYAHENNENLIHTRNAHRIVNRLFRALKNEAESEIDRATQDRRSSTEKAHRRSPRICELRSICFVSTGQQSPFQGMRIHRSKKSAKRHGTTNTNNCFSDSITQYGR